MKKSQSLTLADYSRLRQSSNKYKAVRTEVDGISFASRKEARRYGELKLLEQAGVISNLTMQDRFSLDVGGVHICTYVADFCYDDDKGNVIVEDVKSPASRTPSTPVYRIKKSLMKALYKIDILDS